ncbi:methyltransferase type 11 [Delphinella strobiligena]|nr:methyltransferase type 11 [Delphinella strobiligena]
MSDDPRTIVQGAYDNISNWYLDWVKHQDSPRERYTKKLLDNLSTSPSILELGCGPGVPILRMLLDRGAEVVANDISAKQLELAKARCPEASFVAGDMAALSFEPGSLDGVVCFFTIFHLPRAEQKDLLFKVYAWLKPGGMFVCNLATIDEEEIHGEFLGHGMFWSSYSEEDNKIMLSDTGFEVLQAEMLVAGEEEDDFDYDVKFLWVAAKKPISSV